MMRRVAQEDTHSRSFVPLWKRGTGLQWRLEDVYWASEWMEVFDIWLNCRVREQ